MFSDIIRIPDTSPTKGDVALVKASNGTVLRKVADDPEWQKIREEGERRREEAAAIRPKKGPSRKRPRTEVASSRNDQDDLGEPPLPDPPVRAQDKLPPLPEHQATNFDDPASHGESHRSPGPSMPTPRLPSQPHKVSSIFLTSLNIFYWIFSMLLQFHPLEICAMLH